MSGTRSSSRLAAHDSSPSSSKGESSPPIASMGTKRKQDLGGSPSSKQGSTKSEKKQKTLEETGKSERTTAADDSISHTEQELSQPPAGEHRSKDTSRGDFESREFDTKNPKDIVMNDDAGGAKGIQQNSTTDSAGQIEMQEPREEKLAESANGAVEPDDRESETPSSILEKGIIFFFLRGRVGIDDPSSVDEIARSYMVLRPLPHGAKIGEGEIGDAGNCRLLSLPKKVLPRSGNDKFLVFVDKAQTSFKDLKDTFLPASDYETKTAGTRHTPAATPVAEGIYAITTTGRESHMAYILTIPSELNEVQRDMGLRERGSFITSIKNPNYPSPPNAGLPQGPNYPQEIIDEFRSLRWMPLQPKHIDYPNAQLLLIGEGDHGAEKATNPQPEDQNEGKETPLEEMEKLEGEDQIRVKHLKGDDAVFADLQISSKDYPKVKSAW